METVEIKPGISALLFSADTGGVSGSSIHFALLRLGTQKDLHNLFPYLLSVSNQSQHGFLQEATISDRKIFVTADFVWGDEGHYAEHRFLISSYVWKDSPPADDESYFLEDRYMTVRHYDLEAKDDVLTAEKPEILARLKRVKAAASKRQ